MTLVVLTENSMEVWFYIVVNLYDVVNLTTWSKYKQQKAEGGLILKSTLVHHCKVLHALGKND